GVTRQGPLGVPAPRAPESEPSLTSNILSGKGPSTGKGTAYYVGSLLVDVGVVTAGAKGFKPSFSVTGPSSFTDALFGVNRVVPTKGGISDLFGGGQKTAREIGKGLSENLPYQVSKETESPKLFTFEQGTEG